MQIDKTIVEHPEWLPSQYILRCLTPEDRSKHKQMSEIIYEALPNKEMLIPMTEDEYDDTYTNENEDVVYGIFDGDRLIATSSLLHDVRAYAINDELKDIMQSRCVEIGESMVLPEFRGNGWMLRLNQLIKEEAKRQGVKYMLATAHPDNIASNTSLQHLGYKIIKEFSRAGKRRNLLVMEVS